VRVRPYDSGPLLDEMDRGFSPMSHLSVQTVEQPRVGVRTKVCGSVMLAPQRVHMHAWAHSSLSISGSLTALFFLPASPLSTLILFIFDSSPATLSNPPSSSHPSTHLILLPLAINHHSNSPASGFRIIEIPKLQTTRNHVSQRGLPGPDHFARLREGVWL